MCSALTSCGVKYRRFINVNQLSHYIEQKSEVWIHVYVLANIVTGIVCIPQCPTLTATEEKKTEDGVLCKCREGWRTCRTVSTEMDTESWRTENAVGHHPTKGKRKLCRMVAWWDQRDCSVLWWKVEWKGETSRGSEGIMMMGDIMQGKKYHEMKWLVLDGERWIFHVRGKVLKRVHYEEYSIHLSGLHTHFLTTYYSRKMIGALNHGTDSKELGNNH